MDAELKEQRKQLRISQVRLARLAGVSRFKLALFELGDGPLSADELDKIREAIRVEAARLRDVAGQMQREGQ